MKSLKNMTKREIKEYYAAYRNTWGDIKPVTRTSPNPRAYNRNKMKREMY
jgi:hypothetical protein